ncbi:MAG: CvpA family protein [Flavobacteriales bacterium]
MNAIDLILIIPLAWAAYKGFKKGFIIEIFSLLALFAGVYGGIHFSDGVANWLDQTIQIKEKYLPVVSFAVTFIGVVVLVFYLGKLIEKAINMAAMKPLNKLAGALFSVLKYGLIMSVILGFLLPINKNLDLIKQSTINESVLAKPIEGLATTVIPAVKESDFYKALNGGKLEQWKDEIIDDLTD